MLLPLVRGVLCSSIRRRCITAWCPTALYNLDCTVIFGTNTFLTGYARKAHPYDFRSVRYLFAGAEKLQESHRQRIWDAQVRRAHPRRLRRHRMQPVRVRQHPHAPAHRLGRASSCPASNTSSSRWKASPNGGRLFVRGPNVMKGYLNPEANAKFQALGGWYDTGDIAEVDDGRLRPHPGPAETLRQDQRRNGQPDRGRGRAGRRLSAIRPALPGRRDGSAGSRTRARSSIAVTNEPRLTLEEIRAAIKAKGLSNLAVPRELKTVKEIPKLGTGKINHRELTRLIEQPQEPT